MYYKRLVIGIKNLQYVLSSSFFKLFTSKYNFNFIGTKYNIFFF